MTGHRAAPPVTTEVSTESDDDLLTAGRPESGHASNFLSAPPLAGSPAGYPTASGTESAASYIAASAEEGSSAYRGAAAEGRSASYESSAGYEGSAGYESSASYERRPGGYPGASPHEAPPGEAGVHGPGTGGNPPAAGYPPSSFRKDGYPPSLAGQPDLYPAPPLADTPVRAPDQPAATCALEARPESVKSGRDFTRTTLLDWGMDALADLAELVVSELVTNALRHGVSSSPGRGTGAVVRLRLLAQAPFVMCMVTDPGSQIPVLRDSDLAAECGRGLQVVEACSVRWGWHLLDGGGKVVWALLR
jgi:anti-sigma regulatory factor (Ser/Thr protein kinase)